jgi:glyoxylase-like metal-dependent hydrolase (beta-lactamase superfamily II)
MKQSGYSVTRVASQVWAVKDEISSEVAIAYLICGTKKVLLFDTNIGTAKISEVIEKITSLPVTVVLSHSHYDHIGGAHEFDEVWGWPSAVMKKIKTKGVSTEEVLYYGGQSFLDSVGQDSWSVEPLNNLKSLNAGAYFDLGGIKLQVIHSPGHSPDSICLYEKSKGWLFSGDTLYRGPIYLDFPESNIKLYKKTLKKLSGLNLKILFPGHNTTPEKPELLARTAEQYK